MGKRLHDNPNHWSDIVGMPDDTVKIKLSQGKVAVIDADNYVDVVGIKWHFANGYARSDAKHGKVYLHRLINKTPKGVLTDHVNGDRLDNRKCNLRNASRAENSYNASGVKNATSKYKGVCLLKSTGKWRARIMVGFKEIHLGVFSTEEEAYEKYQIAAKKYQGKFARV